uniref:A-kinase anchor protein 7 RI-RII subunit-binding domain-containing protein n=1 Tax=Sus scrofa TaxID=9823 RepID=A0A8D0Q360_PIG
VGFICIFPLRREDSVISELRSATSLALQQTHGQIPCLNSSDKEGPLPEEAMLVSLDRELKKASVLQSAQQYLQEAQGKGKQGDTSAHKTHESTRMSTTSSNSRK